jgi:hypothetical protein
VAARTNLRELRADGVVGDIAKPPLMPAKRTDLTKLNKERFANLKGSFAHDQPPRLRPKGT